MRLKTAKKGSGVIYTLKKRVSGEEKIWKSRNRGCKEKNIDDSKFEIWEAGRIVATLIEMEWLKYGQLKMEREAVF